MGGALQTGFVHKKKKRKVRELSKNRQAGLREKVLGGIGPECYLLWKAGKNEKNARYAFIERFQGRRHVRIKHNPIKKKKGYGGGGQKKIRPREHTEEQVLLNRGGEKPVAQDVKGTGWKK